MSSFIVGLASQRKRTITGKGSIGFDERVVEAWDQEK